MGMRLQILGIDPGASGGIAFAHEDGHADCVPMPTTEGDIIVALRKEGNTPGVAYMETLVKHMGAGVPASTMAVYASNHGFLCGALMALGWKLILVRPQDWQKAMGLGVTGRQKAKPGMSQAEKVAIRRANEQAKRDWKNKLKATAQRLYPHCGVTLKTADALLILEYGMRQEKGM